MSSRAITIVVAVALLVALAGCGDDAGSGATPVVDRRQAEDLLGRRVRERFPSLAIGAADCPDGVRAVKGQTFQCTVLIEGQPVRYQMTVAEILGSQLQYDLQSLQTVIDVGGVVNFVRSLLESDWRAATIDCGKAKVRIVEVGATIDCTVYNGTVTRYMQAHVDDKDGAVSVREQ